MQGQVVGGKGNTEADPSDLAVFLAARPRLLGIAYRVLGSHAEAEDAVQDTYLRWQGADKAAIASPGACLTTVCTRRAVDMLRSAYRSRVDYVGNWLPEPIQTMTEPGAQELADLSASLSTAFLLVLERLAPKERAAYLLREIFELDYADVAATLDMNEAACRKLVSRANARVGRAEARCQPPRETQRDLLAAFEDAVRTGRAERLTRLLVDDVRLTADGGGRVATVAAICRGEETIAFLTGRLRDWWTPYDWQPCELNGTLGFILRTKGAAVAAVSFSYDADGLVSDIYIMRNPDKLEQLHRVGIQ